MRKSLLIFFILSLYSCTSTRITSRWHPPGTDRLECRRILVMGLIRSSDWTIRQSMERHLVTELRGRGYQAIASFDEYGPHAFEGMKEDEAIRSIRDNHFDAVLTIVLLDKERERQYNQGQFYFSPFMYYYGNFWGYRMMMYNRIYEPGYWTTSTRYFWESNLFEMPTGRLVYSIQTQSFDPSSTESMAEACGRLITEELFQEALSPTVR